MGALVPAHMPTGTNVSHIRSFFSRYFLQFNGAFTSLRKYSFVEQSFGFIIRKRFHPIYYIITRRATYIWDEKAWELIKCAFTDNCLGSRVMTTTRIGSISKACCSSGDDIIYQMKPLTDDDSKRLFYKRIFLQGSKCPDELEQVCREILKKCGGVPLAIITIASLLASNQRVKQKYEWMHLHNSIGRGVTQGDIVKDMNMILSLSYYDLPSHLKPCFRVLHEGGDIGGDHFINPCCVHDNM